MRENTRSGGVSVFYKNHLKFDLIGSLSVCNDVIETCCVRLKINSYSLYVLGFYRPHSGIWKDSTACLCTLLDQVGANARNRVCLAGDFNANILNTECKNVVIFIINTMQSLHYNNLWYQQLRGPTLFKKILINEATVMKLYVEF